MILVDITEYQSGGRERGKESSSISIIIVFLALDFNTFLINIVKHLCIDRPQTHQRWDDLGNKVRHNDVEVVLEEFARENTVREHNAANSKANHQDNTEDFSLDQVGPAAAFVLANAAIEHCAIDEEAQPENEEQQRNDNVVHIVENIDSSLLLFVLGGPLVV